MVTVRASAQARDRAEHRLPDKSWPSGAWAGQLLLESQEENLISRSLVQNVGWGEERAWELVIQCACQLIITCAWHGGQPPGGRTVAGLRVLQ